MLIAGDEKVDEIREAIWNDLTLLVSALHDEVASTVTYYHSSRQYQIGSSDLDNVMIEDIRIVALGQGEATLAFEAIVEATHDLQWQEQDYDGEWEAHRTKVLDNGTIHGEAKVQLDPKTRRISAVTFLDFAEAELEVSEMPHW